MSLIVLAAAAGSPGVTTTVAALARSWPRDLLIVDADPTGGCGLPITFLHGLTSLPDTMTDLVYAARDQRLGEAVSRAVQPLPDCSARLLPGPRSHAQAVALAELWEPLASELTMLGAGERDVIVDLGRLGLAGSATPVLRAADFTGLLTRCDLTSLAATRQWSDQLRDAAAIAGGAPRCALIAVGPAHPYQPREISDALGLPVLGKLRHDARAGALAGRIGSRISSGWTRDVAALGEAIRRQMAENEAILRPATLAGAPR
ncbi:MAG: hypothetical protein LBM23_00440 [Propionibacteriaceae bacterium]|jgi:hypothetical protein|nr:hypothetical protein [Propionibacteriaceae bacterium]